MAKSLDDFHKERAPKGCFICSIPEREEVEAGKKQTSYRLIAEWLRTERGYEEVTVNKVEAHFRRHVLAAK